MRGFQPARAKPKKNSYANGGPVRGPGTGTSDEVPDDVPEGTYIMPTDSTQAIGQQNLAAMGKGEKVPVNLSNGEFKLPPEQVHAIGVQALDQMKGATHTPVAARGFAPGSQQAGGGEPRMFFANGGVVDDENAKRFVKVPDTIGQQPPVPAPMPAPVSPAPAGNVTGAPGVVRAGNSYEAAPAAPPAAAAPGQISAANTFPQASPSAGANVYGGAGKELGSSGAFATGAERVIGAQPPKPQPPAPAPAVHGPPLSAQIPGYGRSLPVTQPPVPASGVSAAGAPGVVATGNEYAAAPVQSQAAPAQPTAAPARPAGQPAGFSYMDNNESVGRDIKDSWNKGNYGEAIGKTVAGTVGMFTNPLIDGAAGAFDGAKGFGRGLFGMGSAPAAAPAAASAAATTKPVPSGPAATNVPVADYSNVTPEQGRAMAEVNARVQQPNTPQPQQKPAPEPSNTPTSTEVMPGVYRNGNSYGDSAGAALAGAQPRGLPTAQNMAAADALAQRSQQESMGRVRGFSPGSMGEGGAPGAVRQAYSPASSGNFEWMNDLRDPRTLALRNAGVASTVHRNPGEAIIASKAANARVAGVQAAIGTQMHDAQQADTARYQSDNSLAGTQEQASASRYSTDAQAATAQQRNAVDMQRARFEGAKAGQEITARGFDIRSGERQEKLYQKYEAAKTPEERSAIAKQIRDLAGKADPANRFTAVSGGQEWDTKAGAMRNVPGRVFDNQAGQFVEQAPGQGGQNGRPSGPAAPTSKAEYDALPKGTEYIKDGKVMVKS